VTLVLEGRECIGLNSRAKGHHDTIHTAILSFTTFKAMNSIGIALMSVLKGKATA
jgi:hypothetical protein